MTLSCPRITRRGIQVALGLLWFLDGALQLQHQMFTASFAYDVIAPAAQGQPVLVSGVMHLFVRIFLWQPAVFNSFIVLTQMGLGILILWKKTAKYGLLLSVAWGLFVWYFGEGLGGLASFRTVILMGAPGAALIYAMLALGTLPPDDKHEKQENDDSHPAYWLAIFWCVLWVLGAIYQLLPGQNTISSMSSMISGMASGTPGWMYSLDTRTANVIQELGGNRGPQTHAMHMTMAQMARMPSYQDSGYWFILLLAVVQLGIGIGVLFPRVIRKTAIVTGIMLSVPFWVIGQSMGGYFTGVATDPGTAPLFILLGVAILGCTQLDKKLARLAKHIQNVVI